MRIALVALAFALVACGGGASASPTSPRIDPHAGSDASTANGADGGEALASMASLTALGPSLAPGMRESDHAELAGAGDVTHDLPSFEKDTCVRVTFAATAKVSATLVDASGSVLARADNVTSGWLGERGPACARPQASPLKIKLHGEGPLRARLVVWALP
jgi:hypothetical protein